jgi:GGDEF domain-containing protein
MPNAEDGMMTAMADSLGNPSEDTARLGRHEVELGTTAALLDAAEVAVAVLGGDAVIRLANDSFARACGRPVGEIRGLRLTQWVIEDDAAPLGAVVAEVADGATGPQTEQTVDARIVGADGRVRPLRLHLGLVPAGGGELLLCVAQNRSEDRRRERHDRAARVAEATAAETDAEIGIPNRKGLESALASASRRSNNNRSPHALIRCELTVDEPGSNERGAGGTPGPDSMRACIDRIRQSLRPADTVALAEDAVLAVVAEDLHDEQDAAGVAYRLLSTVVEPVPGIGGEVAIRMAIGVVMADGATPPHALMSAAAEAVSDARAAGGFVLMDLRGFEE